MDCGVLPVDIVFVVDQSGSIGAANFAKLKAYLLKRIALISFSSASGPRVAVLGFAFSVNLYCDMRFDKASLLTCIDQIPYTEGGTNTPEAIKQAGAELTRAGCDPAARICLIELITDGEPDLGATPSKDQLRTLSVQYATAEKAKGHLVNSVGVGNSAGLTLAFLEELASTPVASHSARIDNYDNLDNYAQKVSRYVLPLSGGP